MHSVDLTFDCRSPESAEAVRAALDVEKSDGPEGTSVSISSAGARLQLRIEAKDLSALRAAVNSWGRLADAAIRTVDPV